MKRPPKWLRRYARDAQAALGLQAWELTIREADTPDPEHPLSDACVTTTAPYLVAAITFRTKLFRKPTTFGKVTVIHELLHMCAAHRDLCFTRMIDQYVPEKHRKHANALYEDADEQAVVRLSRQIYELMEARKK